jgi:LysM repeat protein
MADIARQWHTSVAAIMMQNNLVREQVSPGQKLKMPQP